MKKWMLQVQEETRLKNQQSHSVHLVRHQTRSNIEKKHGKGKKKGLYNLHKSSQIHKKGHKNDKCHFCHK